MAFRFKGKKLVGTKKKDKIKWASYPILKRNLTVKAGKGNDVIDFRKSKYKNKLYGEAGKDNIKGGKKNDKIYGGSGNDKLYGYAGNDIIKGSTGNDLIKGGTGNDKLYGEKGTNKIYGEAGNDSIWAGTGTDLIYGGAGNDVVSLAKGGKNTVYGEDGDDRVNGGAGTDYIDGGAGNDILNGVAGTNTIIGGAGDDTLYSGTGVDTFRFASGSGSDVVYNATSLDKIEFTGTVDNVEYADDGDDLIITKTTGTVVDTIRIVGYATAEDKIDSILYNGEEKHISEEHSGDDIKLPDGVTFDDLTFKRVYKGADQEYIEVYAGSELIKSGVEYNFVDPIKIGGVEHPATDVLAKTTVKFDLSDITSFEDFRRVGNDLIIRINTGESYEPVRTIKNYFVDMADKDGVIIGAGWQTAVAQYELKVTCADYTPTAFKDWIYGSGTLDATELYEDGNYVISASNFNPQSSASRTNNEDKLVISNGITIDNFNFNGSHDINLFYNGNDHTTAGMTVNVKLTDNHAYTTTSGYREVISGVGSVSANNITANDSISFTGAYLSRTGNGNLVVTDGGDNAITVTDYNFSHPNQTVKVNDDLIGYGNTIRVNLNNESYEGTAYNEEFVGSGTVHGMSERDKIIVNGTPTFSRTNDGPLVVSGTDSAITVTDFHFEGGRNIYVNTGSTAGMTLHVTLSGGANFSKTIYDEIISGNGTVALADLGANDKLLFDGETTYTLTSAGLVVNDTTNCITITGYTLGDNLPIFVGEAQDTLSDKVLNVTGFSTYDGTTQNVFKSLNITGTDGADNLTGGVTSDTIFGGGGGDIIIGGGGSDNLSGGDGGDTFVFASGSGNDTITDADNTDSIKFTGVPGVIKYLYSNDSDDLIIQRTVDDKVDKVTLTD